MPLHKRDDQLKSVIQFANPTTGEFEDIALEKPYLILIQDVDYATDDEYHEGTFVSVRGREAAFAYLESQAFGVDMTTSFVMTGHIHLGEEVSIYSFMRHCIENKKVSTEITVEDLNEYVAEMHPSIDLNLLYATEMKRFIQK